MENNLQTVNHKQIFIRWLLGLSFILVLVGVFTDLAEDVWFREGFSWDAPIILAIHQAGSPFLDTVMRVITQAGEVGAIAVAVLSAVWFVWKNRRVDAFAIMVSLGGAIALNTLLKFLLARPRPALFPPLVTESGFSFPSGHVTASVAVYGFLAVLLWRSKHRFWALISSSLVLIVALSRIYLGVHYPSDTLGAMIFTSLWLMVVFVIRDWYMKKMSAASA
jgi:undecaprenyl-diphosphatase